MKNNEYASNYNYAHATDKILRSCGYTLLLPLATILLAVGLIAATTSACRADWVVNDSTNDVSVSGDNSYRDGDLIVESTGTTTGETTSADNTGVSISGSASTHVDLTDHPDNLGLTVGSYASIGAWASYSWDGPAGYPYGPERFPVHVAASASGSVDNEGETAHQGPSSSASASSAADYVAKAEINADHLDTGGPLMCSGSLDGYVHDVALGEDSTTFFGDETGLTDFANYEGYYRAAGYSGFSLDEDFLIEAQFPPSDELAVSMTSHSVCFISVSNEGTCAASADAEVGGSVSLTFGTPY
jgi:hypothetical protein